MRLHKWRILKTTDGRWQVFPPLSVQPVDSGYISHGAAIEMLDLFLDVQRHIASSRWAG